MAVCLLDLLQFVSLLEHGDQLAGGYPTGAANRNAQNSIPKLSSKLVLNVVRNFWYSK